MVLALIEVSDMKKMKEKSVLNKIVVISICILLAVYALTILSTLIWGLLTSLKSRIDFLYADNKLGFPSLELSREEFLGLKNYITILDEFEFSEEVRYLSNGKTIIHREDVNLIGLFFNTLIYAFAGSIIYVIVTCVMGYMCCKYQFLLSKIIYAFCLFMMSFHVIGTSASEISMMRALNIYDSWVGHFMQKFNFTGMYFFVFFAFFQGVPDSYTEAAEIDGASQFKILTNIIIPLASKTLATVMLMFFITLWNDYQTPLLYFPTHPTLAYGVYYMVYQNPTGPLSFVPIKVAGCMVLAVPILILFICLKDRLMGNVSVGGLKE